MDTRRGSPDPGSYGRVSRPTVLVALDGSAFGDSVLPLARSLADVLGAGLHLVTVLDPALTGGTSTESPECRLQRIDATARLDRMVARLRADGFPATSEVREGSPPEEIVRAGLELSATFVAVAARSRGDRVHLISHGVAQSVIASGSLSLLVTRGPSTLEADRRTDEIRRIVVGVDGSGASHRALRLATLLAGREGSEVLLLHVLPEEEPLPLDPRSIGDASSGGGRDGRPRVERYLRRLERFVRRSGLHARSEVLRSDDVGASLEAAARKEVDVIVVGAHGAGASGCRYGRCARRLLLSSTTPLLLVQDRPASHDDERVQGAYVETNRARPSRRAGPVHPSVHA